MSEMTVLPLLACGRPARGFTMIELAVVLAIVAILLRIAAPGMSRTVAARALAAQSSEFMAALRFARSEALKRGSAVTVCAAVPPGAAPGCQGPRAADWRSGWIVFADRERRGGLGFMRMRGAFVNMQFANQGPTQAIMRDHAFDRTFDDQFGMAAAARLRRLAVMPADEAGVTHVFFLNLLLSGKDRFFGVDNNDVIAGIDVAGKNGLVFAAKEYGGFFSHTTDNLIVRVDNIPLAFNLLGLGAKSFHREPKIKPCRTRCVKDFRGYFFSLNVAADCDRRYLSSAPCL